MNATQTDLEMAVLSSILWRPELTPTAIHHIPMDLWTSEFAFQSAALREVAECVADCWNMRRDTKPVNVIAAAAMRGYKNVENTVRDLMSRSWGDAESTLDRMALDLAGQIRKARLASLIGKAGVLLASEDEPEKIIGEVVGMINNNVGSGLNIVTASDASRLVQDGYLARRDGKGRAIGIPTGLRRIDQIVGGIPTSAVSIIGARPSQGKTALACCIAINAAREGFPVIFFSHEMEASDIFQRMICAVAGLSFKHLRNGRLSQKGELKLANAVEEIRNWQLAVIDTGGPLPAECRTTAMYLINKWQNPKPPLILVDYIQLEHLKHETRPDFRVQELQEISHYWCETSKIMQAGVVLLSQLNRDADGNQPTMSQLAMCGALEQDATLIGLLWRPSKDRRQDQADAPVDKDNRKKAGYNWGVLSIPKSRNSDLTEQELFFSGYNMYFRDWDAACDQHLTKSEMMKAEYNAYLADIISNSPPPTETASPRVDASDIPY